MCLILNQKLLELPVFLVYWRDIIRIDTPCLGICVEEIYSY